MPPLPGAEQAQAALQEALLFRRWASIGSPSPA
jgi:hypothetical protein